MQVRWWVSCTGRAVSVLVWRVRNGLKRDSEIEDRAMARWTSERDSSVRGSYNYTGVFRFHWGQPFAHFLLIFYVPSMDLYDLLPSLMRLVFIFFV
jgi:hypothetical protein